MRPVTFTLVGYIVLLAYLLGSIRSG